MGQPAPVVTPCLVFATRLRNLDFDHEGSRRVGTAQQVKCLVVGRAHPTRSSGDRSSRLDLQGTRIMQPRLGRWPLAAVVTLAAVLPATVWGAPKRPPIEVEN